MFQHLHADSMNCPLRLRCPTFVCSLIWDNVALGLGEFCICGKLYPKRYHEHDALDVLSVDSTISLARAVLGVPQFEPEPLLM